jgi:G:T-mismatch repair DNA endonuclease (very short patch repair protein)
VTESSKYNLHNHVLLRAKGSTLSNDIQKMFLACCSGIEVNLSLSKIIRFFNDVHLNLVPFDYHTPKCLICGNRFKRNRKSDKLCRDCVKSDLSVCKCGEVLYRQESCNTCSVAVRKERFTAANADSWVECPECGFRAPDISLHLLLKHRINSPAASGINVKSEMKKRQMCGEKNPGFNHGGVLSPFSAKFKHYKNSEEHAKGLAAVVDKSRSTRRSHPERRAQRIEYWLDKGYSLEDAVTLRSERQRTFTLAKCVRDHGKSEGTLKWRERQVKWQRTLDAKSPDEKARINRARTKGRIKSSAGEKDLLKRIEAHFPDAVGQFMIKRTDHQGRFYLFDIKCGDKIIEYNGDYWHANPAKYPDDMKFYRGGSYITAKQIHERDTQKLDCAREAGFEVFVVWESDFKENKDRVVEQCLNFLKS